MFTAINKNTGEKVYISKALSAPDNEYICPVCGDELIIKNGDIVVPHFAHKRLSNCDTFTSDMSEWHRSWQEMFPEENREVVMSLEIGEFDFHSASVNYNFSKLSPEKQNDEFYALRSKYPGDEEQDKILIKHRADICIGNYVIEFQNSPLDHKEFNERNWFYNACGYKVIWLFNFQDKDICRYNRKFDKKGNPMDMYEWKHPFSTLIDFGPQFEKGHYDEDHKWVDWVIAVFIQKNNVHPGGDTIEKLIWAPQDEETDNFNYWRFFTGDKFTDEEFANNIINKKFK